MLSVCIPVYNFNVSPLVKSLIGQAGMIGIPFEIIIIDDFSCPDFRNLNQGIKNEVHVRYYELEKNIGRAAIRNMFLNYTNFDNMLFLDCDSQVLSDQFIQNYLKYIDNEKKVVCGGTIYESAPASRSNKLRWKYGICRESLPFDIRNKMPYHSFRPNNFLISRRLLSDIRFNEKLTGYGHEDTLFGYQLKQFNIPVIHINNPVLHDNNESHFEFLKKTRQALRNLNFIVNELEGEKEFYQMNRLLMLHILIKKYYLQVPLLLLYFTLIPFILMFFVAGFSGLTVFDFYKLGYYNWIDLKRR
jgi:hypothetical protein